MTAYTALKVLSAIAAPFTLPQAQPPAAPPTPATISTTTATTPHPRTTHTLPPASVQDLAAPLPPTPPLIVSDGQTIVLWNSLHASHPAKIAYFAASLRQLKYTPTRSQPDPRLVRELRKALPLARRNVAKMAELLGVLHFAKATHEQDMRQREESILALRARLETSPEAVLIGALPPKLPRTSSKSSISSAESDQLLTPTEPAVALGGTPADAHLSACVGGSLGPGSLESSFDELLDRRQSVIDEIGKEVSLEEETEVLAMTHLDDRLERAFSSSAARKLGQLHISSDVNLALIDNVYDLDEDASFVPSVGLAGRAVYDQLLEACHVLERVNAQWDVRVGQPLRWLESAKEQFEGILDRCEIELRRFGYSF